VPLAWPRSPARRVPSAAAKSETGPSAERRSVVLGTEGDDTDPSPLLLVYSAEDYAGGAGPDYAREAMLKQAWAWLLCEVQVADPGSPLALKIDALLTHTTDGIFNFLGRTRQKNLCRLVRERLFAPIREYWNKGEHKRDDIEVALNGQVLSIRGQPMPATNVTFLGSQFSQGLRLQTSGSLPLPSNA